MQPLGKARIAMLGIEVSMVILLAGFGLSYISIVYVIFAVLASTFYVVIVVIETFKWLV